MVKNAIIALLLLTAPAFGLVYQAEVIDGDGYYGGTVGGLNWRIRNFGACGSEGIGGIKCYYHTETDNNTYTIGVLALNDFTTQGLGYAKACTLFVKSSAISNGGNVAAFFQLKPYIEGGACGTVSNGTSSWDEWYQHTTTTLDTFFNTAGVVTPAAWGEPGTAFNRSDNADADRTSSASATVSVTADETWYGFALDTTYVNKFLRSEGSGAANFAQMIVLLVPASGVEVEFYDRADAAGGAPSFHIWFLETSDFATAPTRGHGMFGRHQNTGVYLNDR